MSNKVKVFRKFVPYLLSVADQVLRNLNITRITQVQSKAVAFLDTGTGNREYVRRMGTHLLNFILNLSSLLRCAGLWPVIVFFTVRKL